MNNGYNKQNNSYKSNDLMPWIVVGICLLVFWPLGLVLLIKKLDSGTAARSNRRRYENEQWRQNWRSEQEKWRTAWREGKWGQGISNFIDSVLNFVNNDSQDTSPYNGYYQRSEQSEQAPKQPAAYSQLSPLKSQHARYTNNTKRKGPQAQETAQPFVNAEKADETEKQPNTPGKALAVVLTLLGVILSLGGIVLASLGISQYVVHGLSVGNLLIFILGVFCLLGGISCFITRGIVRTRTRRFKKYAAIIGSNDVIAVADISETVGASAAKTRRTLQLMIDAGYFGPRAYIDSSLDSLVRSFEAAEKERAARAGKTSAGTEDRSAIDGNRFVAVINELHMLCIKTSDPTICAKIQKIEELTAKIFRTVEDNPEKLPQIRRFLNFYLPTTLKLLHSYETLEKQGVNGDNIQSAKQNIERILDTLTTGFEQQLDHLFISDKLDISSDIDVLENLMHQDGLTRDSQFFKTAGGN